MTDDEERHLIEYKVARQLLDEDPDAAGSSLPGYIQSLRREVAQLQKALDLLSEAAPLTWVANQDMDGAATWERRAYALLQGPTKVVNGDPIKGCDPSA